MPDYNLEVFVKDTLIISGGTIDLGIIHTPITTHYFYGGQTCFEPRPTRYGNIVIDNAVWHDTSNSMHLLHYTENGEASGLIAPNFSWDNEILITVTRSFWDKTTIEKITLNRAFVVAYRWYSGGLIAVTLQYEYRKRDYVEILKPDRGTRQIKLISSFREIKSSFSYSILSSDLGTVDFSPQRRISSSHIVEPFLAYAVF